MSLWSTCEACWECVLAWQESNEEVSGSGDSALFEDSLWPVSEQLWAGGDSSA